jgi:hypothetical protein
MDPVPTLKPTDSRGERTRVSGLSGLIPLLGFLAFVVVGATVAQTEHSKHSGAIEYTGGHHTLRLQSSLYSEIRTIEESWFDRDSDGYTDEVLISASAHPELGPSIKWWIVDGDRDGWFETVEITVQAEDYVGTVSLTGRDPSQKLSLVLEPVATEHSPVRYADAELNGELERVDINDADTGIGMGRE